jgi:hypothetical protein
LSQAIKPRRDYDAQRVGELNRFGGITEKVVTDASAESFSKVTPTRPTTKEQR